MHQQLSQTRLSGTSFPPVDKIQLWLEEEDKEESKRIGKLKEQQKKRQKHFEEQLRQRQQQDSRPTEPFKPSPPDMSRNAKIAMPFLCGAAHQGPS